MRSDNALGTGRLPFPVRRALQLFMALYAVCLLVEGVCRFFLHKGFPYTWPFRPYYPPFPDLAVLQTRFASYHTPEFFSAPGFPFSYPASISVVLALLFRLPQPLPVFLAAILLCFATAATVAFKRLKAEGLSSLSLAALIFGFAVSFPLWFEFQQANSEVLVWLMVSLGICAVVRAHPYTAAACFSIAGSMKIYPFVFLGLILAWRQYRQLAFGIVVAITLTAGSLWLETGSVALSWAGTAAGLEYFQQHYTLTLNEFDHSTFELLKRIISTSQSLHDQPGRIDANESARMLRFYMPAVAVGGIAVFFARILKMPVVNRILALSVASILLPPVSFNYTLIHLYGPCGLLILISIRSAKSGVPVRGLAAALAVMAVLLAPETELIAFHFTLDGEIKCLALITLFVISLRYPFVLNPAARCDDNAFSDVRRLGTVGDRAVREAF